MLGLELEWNGSSKEQPSEMRYELIVTYVCEIVLKGCVITHTRRVRPRAWNHATFQNDISDISYTNC